MRNGDLTMTMRGLLRSELYIAGVKSMARTSTKIMDGNGRSFFDIKPT